MNSWKGSSELQPSFIWELDGGDLLTSRSSRFIHGGKNRYRLNNRLCGPQNQAEWFGEDANLSLLPGFETRIFQSASLLTTSTELSQFKSQLNATNL